MEETLSKIYGGIGILDIRCMNISLLLKWWWKLKNPQYSSIWKQIIMEKYHDHTALHNYSPIWKEILKLDKIGKMSSTMIIGDGRNTKFWTDIWINDSPLSTTHYHLYQICVNKEVTVFDVVLSQGQSLEFNRQLGGRLLIDFHDICSIINSCQLSLNQDQIKWRWCSSGLYTSKSTYDWLVFRGITDINGQTWWHLHVPLKNQIFMWLLQRKRIQTRDLLAKRGWPGELVCNFCNEPETVDQLFVHCQFAHKIWFWMGDFQSLYIHWPGIDDIMSFATCLAKPEREAFLIFFSAFCWILWKILNDITFNRSIGVSFRNAVLMIVSLLNFWADNLSEEHKKHLKRWIPRSIEEIPLQVLPPVLRIAG